MDIAQVVDSVWEHAQRRSHYPVEWRGRLTMRQACQVQLGLLDRYVARGERQAGWKIGLTAPVIQAQFGVTEPVMGFLLESGHCESGAAFRFGDLIHPGFENELCFTVGVPLRGPGVTREQARAAVATVQPAFEIVEGRGDFSADLPLSVADNSQQKAFVTGPGSPLPAGWEPPRTTVEVRVNGALVEEAVGSDRTGDQLGAIAWLANKLADLGRQIEAGHRIMAGSFTRQYPIAAGDRLETRFTPFGAVRATFE